MSDSDEEESGEQTIDCLEMRPRDEWFVEARSEDSRVVWYLRFTMTGLYPRLYGPFDTQQDATLALDRMIGKFSELWQEFDDVVNEFSEEREFERIHWGPLIEHPLLHSLNGKTQTGEGHERRNTSPVCRMRPGVARR